MPRHLFTSSLAQYMFVELMNDQTPAHWCCPSVVRAAFHPHLLGKSRRALHAQLLRKSFHAREIVNLVSLTAVLLLGWHLPVWGAFLSGSGTWVDS